MINKSKFLLLCLYFFTTFQISNLYSFQTSYGDFEYHITSKFKPESFFGKNISLLNNKNETDKIWFSRHTLDLNFDALWGQKTYEHTIAQFYFTLRNKAIWGNPESITRTTEAESKVDGLEAVGRPHRHGIPRHILWMREGWLKFDLSEALDLSLSNKHSFTIGAFSFELGRGIALGDAYAVGPEILGFYTDSAVDQYAFGGKFSGDIIADQLSYDLYAAILQNRSSNLGETAEKILGQEFGRLKRQQRGFGKINFVIAGHVLWHVFNNRLGKFYLEPYGLFNHDPEQEVEFLGDATSKLGTIGLAGEYAGDKIEFGFDYAVNLGQQRVKGWDRNKIIKENRDGMVVLVNDKVLNTADSKKILYVNGSDAQNIINETFRDESQNGREIGKVTEVGFVKGDVDNPIVLKNANDRFRNPFTNKFEGWMFIADAAWWIYKKDLQLTFVVGVASGDDNPNIETKDGVFSGFIGLQELYSGKRVKSAFLLGGAGKLNRPLSQPTENEAPSKFANVVSGFTNLVFVGGGLHWIPQNADKYIKVNPNTIVYWQEKQIGQARTFLGVESDIFVYFNMLEQMQLFFVASAFFPGSLYKDRSGVPLTSSQDEKLDRLDVTGFEEDPIPNLGNDIAFTINFGLDYKF